MHSIPHTYKGLKLMPAIIELREIGKYYPLVKANDRVSLKVNKGEIHAIVGENGAGKTTLMNILYGIIQPDSGSITVKGQYFPHWNTNLAIQQGIGMVHQSFKLIPNLSVAENIILGCEPTSGLILNLTPSIRKIEKLIAEFQMDINPRVSVSCLSYSQLQQVEILKTLYRKSEIIILDEPTAVLPPHQIKQLFNTLRKLQQEGKTLLLISHKLSEVLELANMITVMRRGKAICCLKREEASEQLLASLIMGEYRPEPIEKKAAVLKEVALQIKDVYFKDANGLERLKGFNLELHNGEILGLAGIANNGQQELRDMLIGMIKPQSGQIYLFGRQLAGLSTGEIKKMGVALIAEEGQYMSLIPQFTLKENLILGWHRGKIYSTTAIMRQKQVEKAGKKMVKKFKIHPSDIELTTSMLSGGNQQRLIIARELAHNPQLIIACQPTQGLDVASASFVHQLLIKERNQGKAILLISTDLDEIMELSDRIAIIRDGSIIRTLFPAQAKPEEIGLLMTAGIK